MLMTFAPRMSAPDATKGRVPARHPGFGSMVTMPGRMSAKTLGPVIATVALMQAVAETRTDDDQEAPWLRGPAGAPDAAPGSTVP